SEYVLARYSNSGALDSTYGTAAPEPGTMHLTMENYTTAFIGGEPHAVGDNSLEFVSNNDLLLASFTPSGQVGTVTTDGSIGPKQQQTLAMITQSDGKV